MVATLPTSGGKRKNVGAYNIQIKKDAQILRA